MRVYRWDLDKTYLITDFNSVRGLVRSAIEPAHRKRATPGATALLRELGREAPGWRARISIVSGSPTQMRSVLEEKLRMDGVRWDTLTLKDNLANLKRGRLRAVRDQFGYKLPHLLAGRIGLGEAVRETLFGDDAEIDALVYSVYADAIAGRIGAAELSRIMVAAGSYPDHVVDALSSLRRVGTADAVDRIFIRLDRGRPPADFLPLGSRVVPIRGWFQAALVLFGAGEVDADGVVRVFGTAGLTGVEATREAEDILARGHVSVDAIARVCALVPDAPFVPGLSSLSAAEWPYLVPSPPVGVDYLALLAEFTR